MNFFETVKEAAVKRFDQRGEHLPVFYVEAPDGMILVPTPWQNQTEKELAVEAIRLLCQKVGAKRVVIVTEGWMVVRPRGTDTRGLTPSQEADRIEVLWIMGQTAIVGETATGSGMFRIDRSSGKPKLVDWQSTEDGQSMSLFDGLVGRGVLS